MEKSVRLTGFELSLFFCIRILMQEILTFAMSEHIMEFQGVNANTTCISLTQFSHELLLSSREHTIEITWNVTFWMILMTIDHIERIHFRFELLKVSGSAKSFDLNSRIHAILDSTRTLQRLLHFSPLAVNNWIIAWQFLGRTQCHPVHSPSCSFAWTGLTVAFTYHLITIIAQWIRSAQFLL